MREGEERERQRRGKGKERIGGRGVGWKEDGRGEVVGLRKFKIPYRKKACP